MGIERAKDNFLLKLIIQDVHNSGCRAKNGWGKGDIRHRKTRQGNPPIGATERQQAPKTESGTMKRVRSTHVQLEPPGFQDV